jgi:hypothetical protein
MDASHPEICLSCTAIIPAAPQETVGDAGIDPELLRCSLVEPNCLNQLSHHIPN